MKTVWLITSRMDSPTVYIGAESWLTYQRHKAKQFDSPEEAKAHLQSMNLDPNLASRWEVIPHTMHIVGGER